MEYISIYSKPGDRFHENNKTNCFRFLITQWLHLMLPYHLAKTLTTEKNDESWLGQLESKDMWKHELSFFDDLKRISKDHKKMRETVKQIIQQVNGSNIGLVQTLMKGLEL